MHFKAQMVLLLTAKLINFLARILQCIETLICIRLAHNLIKKKNLKGEYFRKIVNFQYYPDAKEAQEQVNDYKPLNANLSIILLSLNS